MLESAIDPEMLETTTLSDRMQTFIMGIQGNEAMTFNTNYDKTGFTALKALRNKVEQYGVWFGGTENDDGTVTPTGTEGKFNFPGQLNFSYEGKDYTLEYTRRTIKQMEDEGFVARDIDDRPMTLLPALFAGAFKAHHRFVKQDVIDEIYSHLPNKDKLIEKLAEMYNEPIQSLMEEPEDAAKNVEWMASW